MNAPSTIARHAPLAGLLAVVLGVYFLTLYPGVGEGDTAELQCNSPMLGVLHSPGYPFVVMAGKLFSWLPIGDSIAYRVNLMCGVFAAAAVGLLYACLRRMTGCTAAALSGAFVLAVSSIFWKHAVLAEVYSFYAMTLMAGIYCAVRFVQQGGHTTWFLASAALFGVVIANRPSELFILPALLAMWVPLRKSAPLRWHTILLAAAVAAIPFVVSVAYVALRESPVALHSRDDLARDAAVDTGATLADAGGAARWNLALKYCLGLKWTQKAEISAERRWQRLAWDIDKYAWLMSGAGAVRDRFPPSDVREIAIKQVEQGRGASIGPVGLLLALFGLTAFKRWPAWTLLGLLMFVGNTAFYLYHYPPDNLDFIIPGLTGLAILVGLGVAGGFRENPTKAMRWSLAGLAAVASVFLLVSNFDRVREVDLREADRIAASRRVPAADLPQGTVLATNYLRTQTLRYLLHVEAGRSDIRTISIPGFYTRTQLAKMADYLRTFSGPVFVPAEMVDRALWRQQASRTPEALQQCGMLAMPR